MLLLSQLHEQPGRLAVTVLSVALGVALGAVVYLVNAAALNEFGLATQRLVGDADVVIRGPRDGFAESLYGELAQNPAVRAASPVLELEVALPANGDTLKVLGLDPFVAATLQPVLIGDVERRALDLFAPDAIVLSNQAAAQLGVRPGDRLRVVVGDGTRDLRVIDVLPEGTYTQALGIMDIASAQWLFGKVGRLNRIDLSLKPGIDAAAFRATLNRHLPVGNARHCAAGRARPGCDGNARVSSESEHAGTGRTLDGSFPRVLDPVAVGSAATPILRPVARARRHPPRARARPPRRRRVARSSAR